MRTLTLPPDAVARQQMLAQLHSGSKPASVKPVRQTAQEAKRVS